MTFYGFARGVVKTVLTPLYRVQGLWERKFPGNGGSIIMQQSYK